MPTTFKYLMKNTAVCWSYTLLSKLFNLVACRSNTYNGTDADIAIVMFIVVI